MRLRPRLPFAEHERLLRALIDSGHELTTAAQPTCLRCQKVFIGINEAGRTRCASENGVAWLR